MELIYLDSLRSKIYATFSAIHSMEIEPTRHAGENRTRQPVMPVKTGIQKTAPRPLTLDSAPVFTGVARRNDGIISIVVGIILHWTWVASLGGKSNGRYHEIP